VEVTELGCSAASAPDSTLTYGHNHAVPRVGDFLRFDCDAGPRLKKAAGVLREAFEAKVGSGVGSGRMTNKTSGSNKSTLARKSPSLHRS
jgi:hypothetical protein